ncbi:hypothetical protein FACS1894122_04270 [Alphaproteobacteria bacterium]|nr:hypothetical protein FACS1894122_04270 [Alphaproteobacteria bacterium]
MSAMKLTDAMVENLKNDSFDFYVLNFANPDMVGHTGNFDAVVEAIEEVDRCLSAINEIVAQKKGCLIVTADHGNAEVMYDERSSQPHTAHTTNDVPFIFASEDHKSAELASGGGLSDIAPTILGILGIDVPLEMTGQHDTGLICCFAPD